MNAGSNLMMHGVSGLLSDYYNIEQLKAIIKQFTAHNNAAIGVYAERSGKTKEECKNLMTGETWLTGQEAVDAGFADEVIDSAPVQMRLTEDQHFLMANGVLFSTHRMSRIPQGIPVGNIVVPAGKRWRTQRKISKQEGKRAWKSKHWKK